MLGPAKSELAKAPHAVGLHSPRRSVAEGHLPYDDRMLDADEFEQAVEEALEGLPPQFASLLDNVAIVIEEEPLAADLKLAHGGELLGLFRGVPRTHRILGALPSALGS